MRMPSPISPPPTEWTAQLARALPDDGNRYEVLDGELFVTPAPSGYHQRALKALAFVLDPYVREHALGELLWSPADIEFSSRRLVQPDLFVIPALPSGRMRAWSDVSSLLLAVEILSPTTARADRFRKRTIYQSTGVPEYWIVDIDARVVERWRPEDERPEILADTLTWAPRADAAPLEIDLPRWFAAVLD
jgi:Uma2 family endonuclease